jgi:hypothetical protein
MERADPLERPEVRSGDASGRRHTSYVETPALVQLTWDTTDNLEQQISVFLAHAHTYQHGSK